MNVVRTDKSRKLIPPKYILPKTYHIFSYLHAPPSVVFSIQRPENSNVVYCLTFFVIIGYTAGYDVGDVIFCLEQGVLYIHIPGISSST